MNIERLFFLFEALLINNTPGLYCDQSKNVEVPQGGRFKHLAREGNERLVFIPHHVSLSSVEAGDRVLQLERRGLLCDGSAGLRARTLVG